MRDDSGSASDKTATSGAWPAFEARLAGILGALEEDQFLVISAKRGWAYVQFSAQGAFGLRAEAVSNHYLPESHALSARRVAALKELGWSAPTGTPRESTPKRQPDGSPNFFVDFDRPVPFVGVARLAVRTLTEVLGISHPGQLHYDASDANRRSILLPTLGLMRRPSAPVQAKSLADTIERIRERVLDAIREASGDADLAFDEEWRIALRFGTALVFVRVHDEPLCVSLTSPILTNVGADDLLVERLNDLNTKVRFARLFLLEGTVYAVIEVPASPFAVEHVVDACGMIGHLADQIDQMLQEQFGGRTAFGEFRTKSSVH